MQRAFLRKEKQRRCHTVSNQKCHDHTTLRNTAPTLTLVLLLTTRVPLRGWLLLFFCLLRRNEAEHGLQTDGGELAARRLARAAIVAGAERQLDQHRRA